MSNVCEVNILCMNSYSLYLTFFHLSLQACSQFNLKYELWLRWKYCLRHFPVRCRKARFGLLVFFYNFVDNIVPGKLGDLYASHLAWINCGIRRSSALGSILFLRTVDAWVVFSLAGLVSWLLFAGDLSPSVLWALIAGCIFAVATTVVMLAVIFLKGSVKKWFPDSVQQRIEAFRHSQ